MSHRLLKGIKAEMEYKIGDIVVRRIGTPERHTLMDMQIMHIDDKFLYCLAVGGPHILKKEDMWRFEKDSGIEYDPDLHWGSEWGATGSKLIGLMNTQ